MVQRTLQFGSSWKLWRWIRRSKEKNTLIQMNKSPKKSLKSGWGGKRESVICCCVKKEGEWSQRKRGRERIVAILFSLSISFENSALRSPSLLFEKVKQNILQLSSKEKKSNQQQHQISRPEKGQEILFCFLVQNTTKKSYFQKQFFASLSLVYPVKKALYKNKKKDQINANSNRRLLFSSVLYFLRARGAFFLSNRSGAAERFEDLPQK